MLSADFAVHLVEIVERLQYPERFTDRCVNDRVRTDRTDAVGAVMLVSILIPCFNAQQWIRAGD